MPRRHDGTSKKKNVSVSYSARLKEVAKKASKKENFAYQIKAAFVFSFDFEIKLIDE